MTKNCDRCGAMINYAPGATVAKCDFCHAEYPVESAPLPTASPYWAPPPAQPFAPSPYQPSPQPLPLTPPRHFVAPTPGAGSRVGVFVVVCLVAGAGAVFARLRAMNRFFPIPPPTFGTFTPDPTTGGTIDRVGSVSGDAQASRVQTDCRGYTTREPQIIVNLAGTAGVQFAVQSRTDTTLVVRRPNGAYICDDDSGGATNPLINATLDPGLYTVWVGTFSRNTTAQFTLHVEADAPVTGVTSTGVAPDATPLLGTLDLDATPSDTRPGVTQQRLELSRGYPQCRGFSSIAPTLTFHTSTQRDLVLATHSNADLTMLIRDEHDAVRCDDDGGEGQNPLIRGSFEPGTYQVWVGVFRRLPQAVDFTLETRTETPAAIHRK